MSSAFSERPPSIFAPAPAEPSTALHARPVFANEHYELVEVGRRVLRLNRGPEAFVVETLPATMRPLLRALDGVHRPSHAIVTDLRRVIGNNDPRFEKAFGPWRRAVYADWGLCVVLCGSEVGRMQLQRHMAEDDLRWRVTTDEREGLRLAHGFASSRRAR